MKLGSPNKAFLVKFTMSESSGKSDAEIAIKDGRTFTRKYQFGSARLADYKKVTKEKFNTADFKQDEALWDKVAAWNFGEIQKEIDKLGNATNEYDRDGLKAVAHLGGVGGMKSFIDVFGEDATADDVRQRCSYPKCKAKGNNTYQIMYRGNLDAALDGAVKPE